MRVQGKPNLILNSFSVRDPTSVDNLVLAGVEEGSKPDKKSEPLLGPGVWTSRGVRKSLVCSTLASFGCTWSRVSGLGFRVSGFRFGFRVSGVGFCSGSPVSVSDLEIQVSVLCFGIQVSNV